MKNIKLFVLAILVLTGISCKKYLDKTPNWNLAVPQSLKDYQAIMDRESIYGQTIPQIGDVGCDDYYVDSATYQSGTIIARNTYLWKPEIWDPTAVPLDWSQPYSAIYHSNVVIDGLKDFQATDADQEKQKNQILGHAFFVRGLMHFHLEEIFGQPYRPATAASDLGIPLKITSNLASIATRSTVLSVYNQITSDLRQAADYLPDVVPSAVRPSKAAAYAMLAKAYLTMQDYSLAGKAADSSLAHNSYLHDFNSLPQTGTNPFSAFAAPRIFPEVLYMAISTGYSQFRTSTSRTMIDTNLINSYDVNDLRKNIYFQRNTSVTPNTFYFKTHYSSNANLRFAGLAVDEVYLIQAECYARQGKKDDALRSLNTLLRTRWKSGFFADYTAATAEEALKKVLDERRKELIARSIRWSDLRRLNQDVRYQVTLTRKLGTLTASLPPNDKRYTYPIPQQEIQLSGIAQNPR